MICALYNDESFDGKIENQLDILDALIGMNVKASLAKWIDKQLSKETSAEKRQVLSDRKTDILKRSASKIYGEKKALLMQLSHAIIICNGNSLVGFQSLQEDQLTEKVKS